uniref:Outer membrane protein beta-barrel domain-containing protein n=1 Tax=uncultured delta proteobacterium HF0130_20J24 TaxID=710829 RepID=E0XXQ5_9DELT|nr:hypothetical protein [uncultured delta proteobacterium HF0130_20J24]
MKQKITFLVAVVLVICTSDLYAEPSEGLGLFLDFGQTKAVNHNTGTEYQTSKIGGVQYDYLFTLGDSFSFSIFGTEFVGKGVLPDNTKYEYFKAGILGAELRTWVGPLFFGVHGGQYFLTWIESLSLSSYSGIKWSAGSGWGFGLEGESGLSLSWYNEKSEKINFDKIPDQRVEGKRILLGYRWR